jgi:hypothetical protein
MTIKTLMILLVLPLVLSACADLSENLYEGVRQQQQAVPDPTVVQPVAQPDYSQYKRERDALKNAP